MAPPPGTIQTNIFQRLQVDKLCQLLKSQLALNLDQWWLLPEACIWKENHQFQQLSFRVICSSYFYGIKNSKHFKWIIKHIHLSSQSSYAVYKALHPFLRKETWGWVTHPNVDWGQVVEWQWSWNYAGWDPSGLIDAGKMFWTFTCLKCWRGKILYQKA